MIWLASIIEYSTDAQAESKTEDVSALTKLTF